MQARFRWQNNGKIQVCRQSGSEQQEKVNIESAARCCRCVGWTVLLLSPWLIVELSEYWHTNEGGEFVLQLNTEKAVLRSVFLVVICVYCALLWYQLWVNSLFSACFMLARVAYSRSGLGSSGACRQWDWIRSRKPLQSGQLFGKRVETRLKRGRRAGVGLLVRAHEQLGECAEIEKNNSRSKDSRSLLIARHSISNAMKRSSLFGVRCSRCLLSSSLLPPAFAFDYKRR